MMDATFFLHALLSAACAVVYADVLVQPGMLLAPVQAWLKRRHRAAWEQKHEQALGGIELWQTMYDNLDKGLDSQWWWKPLWGCATCVSGWFGLLAYLYHYQAAYRWWEHAYFVVLAILFSLIIQKVVSWTRQ